MNSTTKSFLTAGLVTAVGLGTYACVIEPRTFALRKYELPILGHLAEEIKILHLSDLHMHKGQNKKTRWIKELTGLEPDLVVNTGDNLTSDSGIEPVTEVMTAFSPDLTKPSGPKVFYVWGSNDYFAPQLKNPFRYLVGPSKIPNKKKNYSYLDLARLDKNFQEAGFYNINNANGIVTIKGTQIAFSATNDPHIKYDDYQGFPRNRQSDLKLGILHAPYTRLLNEMTKDGADLILAGHTHGGQVNIPGKGALVSNCDLPPSQAKGLSRWSYDDHSSYLEVSAGLGSSKFAPYRFACRPEATLITLTPRKEP